MACGNINGDIRSLVTFQKKKTWQWPLALPLLFPTTPEVQTFFVEKACKPYRGPGNNILNNNLEQTQRCY